MNGFSTFIWSLVSLRSKCQLTNKYYEKQESEMVATLANELLMKLCLGGKCRHSGIPKSLLQKMSCSGITVPDLWEKGAFNFFTPNYCFSPPHYSMKVIVSISQLTSIAVRLLKYVFT